MKHSDKNGLCPACDALAEAAKTRMCRKPGQHVTAREVLDEIGALEGMCKEARRKAIRQLTITAAAIAAAMDDEEDENGGTDARPSRSPVAEWSLSIDDMSRMTGKSRRWFFNHKTLPFIRVISRKTLVGDEGILRRWIAQQRP